MLLGALPPKPWSFYIHDLALAPDVRGTGAGADLVASLATCARAAGLPTMSLIAVNGSIGFWQRQGFSPIAEPSLTEKLRSYSDDAQFMVRDL
jgi:N-acetylglutamate synthase-like GNAT family acetyltransferase